MTDRIDSATHQPTERTGHGHSLRRHVHIHSEGPSGDSGRNGAGKPDSTGPCSSDWRSGDLSPDAGPSLRCIRSALEFRAAVIAAISSSGTGRQSTVTVCLIVTAPHHGHTGDAATVPDACRCRDNVSRNFDIACRYSGDSSGRENETVQGWISGESISGRLPLDHGRRHAIRGPQVGPVDVRSQIFAADGAGGGLFDQDAARGSNLTNAVKPLIDHGGRDINGLCQPGLSAKEIARFFDGFDCHVANYSGATA